MRAKGTRRGKHRPDKSCISLYVDDDFRALLALVSDQSGKTGTDLLMDGIRKTATEMHILRDGKVVGKFVPAIEIIKEEIVKLRALRRNAQ